MVDFCSTVQKFNWLLCAGSLNCEYILKKNLFCKPGYKKNIYIANKEVSAATAFSLYNSKSKQGQNLFKTMKVWVIKYEFL